MLRVRPAAWEKRIVRMIHQSDDIMLAAAFERPDHPDLNQDVGVLAGVGGIGISLQGSLKETIDRGEVIIDFTGPEATLENIWMAAPRGLAMVIGTTGITGKALEDVERLGKQSRCVMSPNMSVGVNVVFKVAEEMALALGPDYDMEILETHHRHKKDAPSGTAVRIAQILARAMKRDLEKVSVYERKGIVGERRPDEIGIQSQRAGDVVGEHTVLFGGTGERVELTHRAHSRDTFAAGAVRAALWVVNQPVGLYDMQDVLGLKKKS